MTDKLSIRDLDFKGKKVLVRVDFNVPIDKGKITDDTRIRASLPTLQYVLDQGGSLILMSHRGRPKGPDLQLSLAPCAKRLEELLKRPVQMAPDCRGPEVEKMVQELKSDGIILLENLRFHRGEEKPEEDPAFVRELAKLGDLYINEAFGSAHRAHASTALITEFFPGRAAAGFHLEQEITYLGSALLYPKRPFYAILGGAKISSKFKVIQTLMKQADTLFIGGAMAYTFFKAQNIPIGQSLVEDEFLDAARQLMEASQTSRCRLLLPIDLVVARQIDPQAETRVIKVQEGIPEGFQGVDIGPETIHHYAQELEKAETIFWNGPLGVFECPPFDKGTTAIAKSLADLSAITIIGGGDSVAAVEQAGVAKEMTHISTGGGASLEYIEFGHLPGIDALSDQETMA
jgi:phosphoglycerate kinase